MKLKSTLTRRRVMGATGLLLASAFAFGLIGEIRPVARRAWNQPSKDPVRVECQAEIVGGTIQISYMIFNQTTESVLVLDQMAQDGSGDEHSPYGVPDRSWGYVEFERNGWSFSGWTYKTILSRRVRDMGSEWACHERMPFGRRLAPGGVLLGSFWLPLPLKEDLARSRDSGPRLKDMPFDVRLDVREFELWIGWIPDMPLELEPDKNITDQFSYHEDKLWYFSSGWRYTFQETQRVAISRAKPVHWRGLLY